MKKRTRGKLRPRTVHRRGKGISQGDQAGGEKKGGGSILGSVSKSTLPDQDEWKPQTGLCGGGGGTFKKKKKKGLQSDTGSGKSGECVFSGTRGEGGGGQWRRKKMRGKKRKGIGRESAERGRKRTGIGEKKKTLKIPRAKEHHRSLGDPKED